MNFVKNLWYLDSLIVIDNLLNNQCPVIFDIGACDGSTVIEFKKVFPLSTVYSFEPFPDSFLNLKHLSNRHTNVNTFELAISNENGFMDFFVNKSKATNSLLSSKITNSFIDDHSKFEKKIKVETKMLDTFLAENSISRIDILKMDVQGGELKILEGAKDSLQKKIIKIIYTEIWFIEGYNDQPLYHDLATYLNNFGYYPFGLYNLHYRKDGHLLWGDAIFYLK